MEDVMHRAAFGIAHHAVFHALAGMKRNSREDRLDPALCKAREIGPSNSPSTITTGAVSARANPEANSRRVTTPRSCAVAPRWRHGMTAVGPAAFRSRCMTGASPEESDDRRPPAPRRGPADGKSDARILERRAGRPSARLSVFPQARGRAPRGDNIRAEPRPHRR